MRIVVLALLLLIPRWSLGQKPADIEATLKFIEALHLPKIGAYSVNPATEMQALKPSIRACNGATRAIKYLGGEIPAPAKIAQFILENYNPQTGDFREPGEPTNVTITAIGIMAALEVNVPKEKIRKSWDYLQTNAKTFEEVRLAAAAVEAWGVKDCPADLTPWLKVAEQYAEMHFGESGPGGAREAGSVGALWLRLGQPMPETYQKRIVAKMLNGQNDDGGWGQTGSKTSDIETTYRVMRALKLLQLKPKDIPTLKEFLQSHANKDGGYATQPGKASSMSGVYYVSIVRQWLNELK